VRELGGREHDDRQERTTSGTPGQERTTDRHAASPAGVRPPRHRWRVARLGAAVATALATGVGVLVAAGPTVSSASADAPSSAVGPSPDWGQGPFLARFHNVLPGPSTVPSNGDVNPYGISVVPQSTGALVQGSVLVSNFNDQANAQGTGTTLVQVTPDGQVHTFATITQSSPTGPCPGGIGLTTALSILPGGFVVVGSLPTTAHGVMKQGTPQGTGPGCLLVLNDMGQVVETWSGNGINGPWDMTSTVQGDDAFLFVTNVLNGTVQADKGIPPNQPGNVVDGGTVLRIEVDLDPGMNPQVESETVIGTGFAERTDPAALVVGPTGDALGWNDTLFVADSVNNRIAAIPDALQRTTPFGGGGYTVSDASILNDPLGMTLAPNGDILTVNGNNGLIVETAPWGQTVDSAVLDDTGAPPGGAGDLFGLAVAPQGRGIWFVDDGTNTLDVFF